MEQKMSDSKPSKETLSVLKENVIPHHKDFLSGEYTHSSPQYSSHQHREQKK